MKRALVGLFLFYSLGFVAWGDVIKVEDKNFSVEMPEGWQQIASEGPLTTLTLENKNPTTKRILICAAVLPQNESRETVAFSMSKGMKRALQEEGWEVGEPRLITVGNITFYETNAVFPSERRSLVTYATMAGNIGYGFQFVSADPDAGTDPEFRQFLASFRLLTPQDIPIPAEEPSEAYKIGYFAGRILAILMIPLLILIAVVVWLFWRKSKKRRRRL